MNTAPSADDDTIIPFEQQAAAEREKTVVEADFQSWNGRALEPWSEGRESVLARLIQLDVPGGDLDDLPGIRERFDKILKESEEPTDLTLEEVARVDIYVPTATKLLYLASHKPEQFFHLRGQPAAFLAKIEQWGEENIAREQWLEACFLAQKIRAAHRALIPMRRVKGSRSPDAGN